MTYFAQIACDLPRDPKMLAAGWQARAVYTEAILFCRENLTDGEITRIQLPLWMPDLPPAKREPHLTKLAELGILETTDDGWAIPRKVWRRWNPTRAQIDRQRAAERRRKAEYRRRKREES